MRLSKHVVKIRKIQKNVQVISVVSHMDIRLTQQFYLLSESSVYPVCSFETYIHVLHKCLITFCETTLWMLFYMAQKYVCLLNNKAQ